MSRVTARMLGRGLDGGAGSQVLLMCSFSASRGCYDYGLFVSGRARMYWVPTMLL